MGLNVNRIRNNTLPKESPRDYLLLKDSTRINFNDIINP